MDGEVSTLSAPFSREPKASVSSDATPDAHSASRNRIPATLDRALALLTDRVFAVSAFIQERLAEHAHIPRKRIAVALNGVDGARFDPSADPVAARAGLGLPEAPTIGIVGRLSPEKNHAMLFAALARMGSNTQHPTANTQLLVVGDGPERERLAAEAARLGVADRVFFLGARDDVPRCLAAMDVVVLCSTTEGLPLAPIEAMAAGRPVVVTDVGGCRELVLEGRVGYVVPSGDGEALARRLALLLADAASRRRMGADARRHFEARFSLERMVATYEAAYAPLGGS